MKFSKNFLAPLALSFAVAGGSSAYANSPETDAGIANDNELSFSCDMPDLSHLDLEDRIDNIISGNVYITVGSSLGSGFIVDADEGYIVTNNHVIEAAAQRGLPIYVTLFDHDAPDNLGERHSTTLIGRDAVLDVAVLRIHDAENLTCVNMGDSDEVRMGETVEAIGNPAGLNFSLSQGIISNRERAMPRQDLYTFFQTDAAINRGNSGGALYNDAGEVIGINFAILSPNGFNAGLGMAIKSNDAVEVIDEIIRTGEAQRASMDASFGVVSRSIAERLDAHEGVGARIYRIEENGVAALSGLQVDDIVRRINGEEVNGPSDAHRIIGHLEPDDAVRVQYMRGGVLQTITVDFSIEPPPPGDLEAGAENVGNEAAEGESPASVIPENSEEPQTIAQWNPRGETCQQVPEESLANYLLQGWGEVRAEDGVSEQGVLRLYADIQGDNIGDDTGSFTIVGHPYIDQSNPEEGFHENVTCLLGNGGGYPDSVLETSWYQEQFASVANPQIEEDAAPVEELELSEEAPTLEHGPR